jgi:hypothetical protein
MTKISRFSASILIALVCSFTLSQNHLMDLINRIESLTGGIVVKQQDMGGNAIIALEESTLSLAEAERVISTELNSFVYEKGYIGIIFVTGEGVTGILKNVLTPAKTADQKTLKALAKNLNYEIELLEASVILLDQAIERYREYQLTQPDGDSTMIKPLNAMAYALNAFAFETTDYLNGSYFVKLYTPSATIETAVAIANELFKELPSNIKKMSIHLSSLVVGFSKAEAVTLVYENGVVLSLPAVFSRFSAEPTAYDPTAISGSGSSLGDSNTFGVTCTTTQTSNSVTVTCRSF